jgi:hypothetical protein
MTYNEVFLGIGAVIVAYQIWVTLQLARSSLYEPNQKWLQSVLIWLIPVLGAIVVQVMMWSDGRPPYKPEKGYTEPGDSAS